MIGGMIIDLEEAVDELEKADHDVTPEAMAYRRGARDAYRNVIDALREVEERDPLSRR